MLRVWAAAVTPRCGRSPRARTRCPATVGKARLDRRQGLSRSAAAQGPQGAVPRPTTRVKVGYHEAKQPLPVNVELLRTALMSDDPARAALVALVAFHGLRAGQLQRLQLTDVRDSRLHVEAGSSSRRTRPRAAARIP